MLLSSRKSNFRFCDSYCNPYLRRFRLKNAGPAKQEAARIDVENAEDDLVQKTEVAITLMKTVLENVRVSLFTSPFFFSLVFLRV